MNKLKTIVAAAIVAVAALSAGLYSYETSQEKKLSYEQELLLDANLEALTQLSAENIDKIDFMPCFGQGSASANLPISYPQYYRCGYGTGFLWDHKSSSTMTGSILLCGPLVHFVDANLPGYCWTWK